MIVPLRRRAFAVLASKSEPTIAEPGEKAPRATRAPVLKVFFRSIEQMMTFQASLVLRGLDD